MTNMLSSLLVAVFTVPQDPTQLASTATNGLGIAVYRQLAAATPDANLCWSPWSVATALAMTAEGARGETATGMRTVLHVPDGSLAAVHASFAALQQRLANVSGAVSPTTRARIAALREQLAKHNADAEAAMQASKYTDARSAGERAEATAKELNTLLATADCYELTAANALWCERSNPLLPDFLGALDRHYGTGGANLVDFHGSPEGARTTINDWVAGRTQQRIRDLIPPGGITADTRLVLTNAVWFRGAWKAPFQTSQTTDAVFTGRSGDTKTVRLMHDGWRDYVPYAAFTGTGEYFATPAKVPANGKDPVPTYPDDDGFQIVELPYKGGDLAMVVLLPRRHDRLSVLESLLSPERLNDWLSHLERREVDTALPRWRQRSQVQLGTPLRTLGMARAFTRPTADGGAQFEGMNGATDVDQKLFVGEALHQAFVEVSEEGTEAAAATAVVMAPGAAVPRLVEMVPFKPVFRADRPFVYLIRDTKSGAVLFLGRVLDPTREG
jgi:serine protease inhibitor